MESLRILYSALDEQEGEGRSADAYVLHSAAASLLRHLSRQDLKGAKAFLGELSRASEDQVRRGEEGQWRSALLEKDEDRHVSANTLKLMASLSLPTLPASSEMEEKHALKKGEKKAKKPPSSNSTPAILSSSFTVSTLISRLEAVLATLQAQVVEVRKAGPAIDESVRPIVQSKSASTAVCRRCAEAERMVVNLLRFISEMKATGALLHDPPAAVQPQLDEKEGGRGEKEEREQAKLEVEAREKWVKQKEEEVKQREMELQDRYEQAVKKEKEVESRAADLVSKVEEKEKEYIELKLKYEKAKVIVAKLQQRLRDTESSITSN
mmetsp:Transcript_23700/g.59729  ORF Transcript_23700/g.59729 Transcript_23700/m.59729 type:complete len:324 (-) Transcript_23700:740-1711(-)